MTFCVEVFNVGSPRSTLRRTSMPQHDPSITFVNIAVCFVQYAPRCFAGMNCAAMLWLQWLTAIDKNFLTLAESNSVIWKYVLTKSVQVKPYFISIQQSFSKGLDGAVVVGGSWTNEQQQQKNRCFFPLIFIKINQIHINSRWTKRPQQQKKTVSLCLPLSLVRMLFWHRDTSIYINSMWRIHFKMLSAHSVSNVIAMTNRLALNLLAELIWVNNYCGTCYGMDMANTQEHDYGFCLNIEAQSFIYVVSFNLIWQTVFFSTLNRHRCRIHNWNFATRTGAKKEMKTVVFRPANFVNAIFVAILEWKKHRFEQCRRE